MVVMQQSSRANDAPFVVAVSVQLALRWCESSNVTSQLTLQEDLSVRTVGFDDLGRADVAEAEIVGHVGASVKLKRHFNLLIPVRPIVLDSSNDVSVLPVVLCCSDSEGSDPPAVLS